MIEIPSLRNSALRPALMGGFVVGFLALAGPAAHAQIYNVALNTTGLTQGAAYTLEYQLTQGSTSNPTSSVVSVSNFVFGTGGSASGAPTSSQGSMGSLQSQPISLANASSPPADFQQNIVNGQSLSFQVDGSQLKSPLVAGQTPDIFSFDLIDSNSGTIVPTNNGTSSNALFSLTQTPAGTFNAIGSTYTGPNGNFTTQVTAAPEMGTSISFGLMLGLFGAGLLRARLTKRSRQA